MLKEQDVLGMGDGGEGGEDGLGWDGGRGGGEGEDDTFSLSCISRAIAEQWALWNQGWLLGYIRMEWLSQVTAKGYTSSWRALPPIDL